MTELTISDPMDLLQAMRDMYHENMEEFEAFANGIYSQFGWGYYYPTAEWNSGVGWIVTCRISLDPRGLQVRGGIGVDSSLRMAQERAFTDAALAWGVVIANDLSAEGNPIRDEQQVELPEIETDQTDMELSVLGDRLVQVLAGRTPICDHGERMRIVLRRMTKDGKKKKKDDPYGWWQCGSGGKMPCRVWLEDSDLKRAARPS